MWREVRRQGRGRGGGCTRDGRGEGRDLGFRGGGGG
jgi:hypothetical protein